MNKPLSKFEIDEQFYFALCNTCKHRDAVSITCKAFPAGIPVDILTGKIDHRGAYPGDRGIRYEKK